MPLTNYNNPSAIRPNYPDQPDGPLAGLWANDDRRMYEDQMNLQKILQQLEVAKQYEDQKQGFGARQAERGANEAKFGLQGATDTARLQNPGYLPSVVGADIGGNQVKAAEGAVAQAGVPNKIAQSNVQGAEANAQRLSMAVAKLKSATGTPLAGQAYNELLDIFPQARNILPPQYNPQVLPQLEKVAQETMKAAVNSPAHGREMEQETLKGQNASIVGANTNITNWEIAKLNNERALEVAKLKADMAAQKENFQQYMSRFMRGQVAAGKMSPEEAAAAIEQMGVNLKTAGTEDTRQLTRELLDPNRKDVNPNAIPRPTPPSALPVQDAEIKNLWGSINRNKYFYRRGPNGLQRALKPGVKQ